MAMFICKKRGQSIPVNTFARVTGVDGGKYEVQNLFTTQSSFIAKDKFNSCFERIY